MLYVSRYIPVALMLLLSLAAGPARAQDCTPSDRVIDPGFVVSGAIVKDVRTELTWMRCALGQQWQPPGCVSLYDRLGWAETRFAIAELNHQGGAFGFSDWRLPTLTELLTIVDSHCDAPALDERIFPRTPVTGYWTSTPDPDYSDGAMLVHFVNGHGYMSNRAEPWAVRLVRGP